MKISNMTNSENKILVILTLIEANFLFWPLDTSLTFIQKITVGIKLTWH